MKYLLIILILFSASLKAQTKDTLVLKTKYSAIILGDKVFNVKVSLEEAQAQTVSKPLSGRRPFNDSYVQKNDFDTKMKDIDSKINKANGAITTLQTKIPKSDTILFNGNDFNKTGNIISIKK